METKWIPVKERLPEDSGEEFIVFDGIDVMTADGFDEDGFYWFDGDDAEYFDGLPGDRHPRITHWMPLPEPPGKEGE